MYPITIRLRWILWWRTSTKYEIDTGDNCYIESLHIDNLRFSYNMTTNAMLLGRYMDYLVEKDFTLLISLDGDEYQSGYRVDKHGKSSFTHVVGNIQKLKDTYPEFFEKNVHFNAYCMTEIQ